MRLLLTVGALVIVWSQWPAGPGARAFVTLWAVAAVIGGLGHTLPGWSGASPGERTSRLPLGVQGLLVGLVAGAAVVLAAQQALPIFAGGLLLALAGVFDDLLRGAWHGLRGAGRDAVGSGSSPSRS